MNILFLTLLYHPDAVEAVSRLTRDGMQNQINNYQWALLHGLEQNLRDNETVTVVNALPVGVFPTRYRQLVLKSKTYGKQFSELGCLNLPGLKQRARKRLAEHAMERWIAASPENRTILVYTLYLPYMQAVDAIRRRHPDVRATVIVTDLPNDLGIASGRTGLLKKIEYEMGERRIALCRSFDGFILLTAPMAEALSVASLPYMVLEGLIADQALQESACEIPEDTRPAVLYTGTLNREFGVENLILAFRGMENVQLWLCGNGDLSAEAQIAANTCPNIRYFGFVPQQTALALQARATVLVNPRTSEGAFTRYSFPSKTLEYMRAGKPVLCCKLEGIPDEYDAYLRYIWPQDATGIRNAVQALLALSETERAQIGHRAKDFALTCKSSRAQGERALDFLRALTSRV